MMKTRFLWIALLLSITLLIAGCAPPLRVGELQTDSQTVELGDAGSVRTEISFGAGDLEVTGGAQELLEADFTYNVARLAPEVEYNDGMLTIRQPESEGFPSLQGITGYQNEWNIRLNDAVPMELSVDVGAGTTDLQLAGLSLTRLDVNLGASRSTIDLSGDWARDLDATIEAGATDIIVRLPGDVGVRVEVESGPHTINASGLKQDEGVYTNDAYGESEVTLQINLEVGIGMITLEVE